MLNNLTLPPPPELFRQWSVPLVPSSSMPKHSKYGYQYRTQVPSLVVLASPYQYSGPTIQPRQPFGRRPFPFYIIYPSFPRLSFIRDHSIEVVTRSHPLYNRRSVLNNPLNSGRLKSRAKLRRAFDSLSS